MKRKIVPESSLPPSHYETSGRELEKQVDQLIWNADAPIVLVSETRKTNRQILTNLQQNPKATNLAILDLAETKDLIPSLKEAVSSLYIQLTPDMLNYSDPEDWTMILRSQIVRGFTLQEGRLLVIENFDHILSAPGYDRDLFGTLISHLACECHLSVLLTAELDKTQPLGIVNGFAHLVETTAEGVIDVPDYWFPPAMVENGEPTRRFSTRCMKSNLLLGSAVTIAAAMVMVSIWVSQQLGVNLAATTPDVEILRAGKIKSVSVAAALPEAPPIQDTEDPIEEFVFDPIPVALGSAPETASLPKPAEKIEEMMPGIPDSAQHLTEEIYLKNLLKMEDFPYESIAQSPAPKIKSAEQSQPVIGNLPQPIKPLKKIEILPEEGNAHLSTHTHSAAPATNIPGPNEIIKALAPPAKTEAAKPQSKEIKPKETIKLPAAKVPGIPAAKDDKTPQKVGPAKAAGNE